jgi:hypothetical protein
MKEVGILEWRWAKCMEFLHRAAVPEGRHERMPAVPLLNSYVIVKRSETNPSNNLKEEE